MFQAGLRGQARDAVPQSTNARNTPTYNAKSVLKIVVNLSAAGGKKKHRQTLDLQQTSSCPFTMKNVKKKEEVQQKALRFMEEINAALRRI